VDFSGTQTGAGRIAMLQVYYLASVLAFRKSGLLKNAKEEACF
jgi:hypothetical protein